jgi:4-aminobutyrate aminotransferase-like enzyme
MASTLLKAAAPAAHARDAAPADLERRYGAANYRPLAVTRQRGAGVWLFDNDGRRLLDMMSAYSAVSFGHSHPTLVGVLAEQAGRLAVTSRAFHSDQLGPFLRAVCEATGMAKALPMNTGAEAVETAVKAARKWGYKVKGIAEGRAEIIVAAGNFAGGRRPSSLLERERSTATASVRSRPASSACRSAMPPRSRQRSGRTPPPSWSSRSRARPGSSSRPPATWRGRARSAAGAASC